MGIQSHIGFMDSDPLLSGVTQLRSKTLSADVRPFSLTSAYTYIYITHRSSLTFGPTREPLSADHRASCMVEATPTLNGRPVMPRAAVAAWYMYGYTTTPRIQIASTAARLSCVLLMSHYRSIGWGLSEYWSYRGALSENHYRTIGPGLKRRGPPASRGRGVAGPFRGRCARRVALPYVAAGRGDEWMRS